MQQLIKGASYFKNKVFPDKEALFSELANGQSPEALFITCSDSRIDPNLITQSEPGDLFICRNAGNIVPPHTKHTGGMTASIEYAVEVLAIRHIVICGHMDCGAMKGALNPELIKNLPHVSQWLGYSREALQTVDATQNLNEEGRLQCMVEQNVLVQLQHLRTHPCVASRLAEKKIELYAWVFDISKGTFTAYNEATKNFESLLEE